MQTQNLGVAIAAMAILSASAAVAQDKAKISAAPVAAATLPDACLLLSKADLEALFPEAEIKEAGANQSPISRGPQYTESCLYRINLPDAEGMDPYATLTIIRWDGLSTAEGTAADSLAGLFEDRQAMATDNADLGLVVEKLADIGDEAFANTNDDTVTLYVRKADLVFTLAVDQFSDQAMNAAHALAQHSSERWGEGVGMQETQTALAPLAAAAEAAEPASATSGADWPDACKLLPEADVTTVLADYTLAETQAMTGVIQYDDGRADEPLPNPMGCWYTMRRTVDGTVLTSQVQLTLENVFAEDADAAAFFQISRKVGDSPEDVPDVGDEAVIDLGNKLTLRKGGVVLHIRVSGGERDQALHDEAALHAVALGKLVVAHMN